MKLEMLSDHEFVLNSVVQMLEEKGANSAEEFDSTIDFAITELTKIHLRNQAQFYDRRFQEGKDVFERAINEVAESIQERIPQFKLNKRYRMSLQELRYPASEIFELTSELWESKETNRIGSRISLPPEGNNSYEIIEVGLTGYIEGLLARPVIGSAILDLDKLRAQNFSIKGDWFPFEVSIDELIFTIDDDGTIFVSTENFPERLMSEAKAQLASLVASMC